MSRFPINERILFDMAVVLAQSLARDAERRRDCAFVRSVRLSGGNPQWLRKPRRTKGGKP